MCTIAPAPRSAFDCDLVLNRAVEGRADCRGGSLVCPAPTEEIPTAPHWRTSGWAVGERGCGRCGEVHRCLECRLASIPHVDSPLFQKSEWVIADIEQAGLEFFGSHVRIEPRALQAMQTVKKESRRVSKGFMSKKRFKTVVTTTTGRAHQIFAGLRSSLPILSTALSELSYENAALDLLLQNAFPLDPKKHPLWELDWNGVYVRCFGTRDEAGRAVLSEAGEKVRRSGYLSVSDLLASVLTADSSVPIEWMPGERGDRARPRNANGLVRRLAGDVGRGGEAKWNADHVEVAAAIQEAVEQLSEFDSDPGQQQVAIWSDHSRIRIAPFGSLGPFAVQGNTGPPVLSRANVVQRGGFFSEDSLDELEELINRSALEQVFQDFFEEHPEYLTMLGPYQRAHSHLVLTGDSGKLIPDLFLEKIDSKHVDLLDIKRPTTELVRNQRNRVRFRDAVMEAVAQIEGYKGFFDDRANREEFERQYGLKGFRPSAFVVIGRNKSFSSEVQRIRLESDLPRWIKLATYDDIYRRAEHWNTLSLKR